MLPLSAWSCDWGKGQDQSSQTLVIELLKTSDYLYISELCDRCESLEESKLRYPLPKDSPAILMQVKKPQEAFQKKCPNTLKEWISKSFLKEASEGKSSMPPVLTVRSGGWRLSSRTAQRSSDSWITARRASSASRTRWTLCMPTPTRGSFRSNRGLFRTRSPSGSAGWDVLSRPRAPGGRRE